MESDDHHDATPDHALKRPAAADRGPLRGGRRPAAQRAIDARWAGALALTWELPAEEPSPVTTQAIADLIQECLSNALIHGRASSATIGVHAGDAAIDVVVTDDGIGPQGGPPGLGATVLASATGGSWELGGDGGGAVVRAAVPCCVE